MPPFVGACSLPTQESCTTGTVRPPRAASRRGPGVFENGLAYRDFAVTQSVASEKSGAHGTCLFNAGMRELSRQESDRRASSGEPFALRFRVPHDRIGHVQFTDAVYGDQAKTLAALMPVGRFASK